MKDICKIGFHRCCSLSQNANTHRIPGCLEYFGIMICLLFSISVRSQTANEIIEKHLAQTGGRENWEAIKSYRITKTVYGINLVATFKFPNKSKTVYGLAPNISTNGFDGETAWKEDVNELVKAPTDIEGYKKNRPLGFLNRLLYHKADGDKMEFIGKVKLGDVVCFLVRGIPNPVRSEIPGESVDYYFNSKDYNLLKKRTRYPYRGVQTFVVEDIFSNFNTRANLVLPFTVESRNIGLDGVDSTSVDVGQIFDLEINLPVDDSEFSFPVRVVVPDPPLVPSSVSSGTADMIKTSLNWEVSRNPDKTSTLKWPQNSAITFSNPECTGTNVVYQGSINGTVIQGQCRIYYENGYFEGIIEPLDLRLLVSAPGGFHRHIPADLVQVVKGSIYNCEKKLLMKVWKGLLSANQRTLSYVSENRKLFRPLMVMDDFNKISNSESKPLESFRSDLRSYLSTNVVVKGMTVTEFFNYPLDEVYGVSYTAENESVKAKWLSEINRQANTPHEVIKVNGEKHWRQFLKMNPPYEILEDNGQRFILCAKAQRPDYLAYKVHLEEDKKRASQLFERQSENNNAESKRKREVMAAQRLGISLEELYAFHKKMTERRDIIAPEVINVPPKTIPGLQSVQRISEKGYPYYGNVSIKLIDSEEKEVGSYSYVYDRLPATDLYSYYNDDVRRELRSTVTQTQSVNRYDVYCDGKKFTTVKFARNQESTYSEGGGGLLVSVLGAVANGMFDRAKVGGYEEDLLVTAQLKGCYYGGNPNTRTKVKAKEWITKAQKSVNEKHYANAISQIDAAIFADENPDYYYMRADIYERADRIGDAFNDYLWLIRHFDADGPKRSELYYKMAVLLAKIPFVHNTYNYHIFADFAPTYINKAAALGNPQAKALLERANTRDEQIQLLRKIK